MITRSTTPSQLTRRALSASLFAAMVAAASSANAADVLKLSTGALSDAAGWNGGVLPGSTNVGLFDSSTVSSSLGISFDASGSGSLLNFNGLKFTDIQGNVTFTNVATLSIGLGGIDMSAATADVTFNSGTIRFGGSQTLNIATGRTLTLQSTSTSNNTPTVTVNGGGTFAVTGTFTNSGGSNRLALLVANGTLAGTGTYRAHNTNTGYGIRVQSGSFIAPGVGGIGTMTIDSVGTAETILQMQAGSGFKFDLGAADGSSFSAAGSSDRLVFINGVASDVTFSDNVIDFLGTGEVGIYKLFDGLDASEAADSWSGLTLDGQSIVSGLVVTNLDDGLIGTLYLGDGASFGDLGDIYLQVTSAIPEPSTFATLAGLAGLGLATSGRRRRD